MTGPNREREIAVVMELHAVVDRKEMADKGRPAAAIIAAHRRAADKLEGKDMGQEWEQGR